MSRRKWQINAWSVIFSLLLCSPTFVLSGGYDDLGGGGSSGGSSSSSGGGVGTDINDYASNNGQIPNHLTGKQLRVLNLIFQSKPNRP